jgi:RNA polymerase sigma-70 factor, ECF subfamily
MAGVKPMKKFKQVDDIILDNKEQLIIKLMNSHGEKLTRLAYTYLKDWGKAEDIVQDVFITCFTKLETFRGEASLQTWLYRITINRCKDYLKSWSFKNIKFSDVFLNFTKSKSEPELRLVTKDEHQELSEKVISLSLKYREVIILHYYEELSIKRISELLNLKISTVKVRLSRGRLLLKNMYTD